MKGHCENVFMTDGNCLIVYFSVTNRTRKLAKRIAEFTGGDLYEIKAKEPYSKFFPKCLLRAAKEKKVDARPEIEGTLPDFSKYKEIFLGYPCWMDTCPQIILTFMDKCDFTGKVIRPFNTHQGGGSRGTDALIRSCRGGLIKKSMDGDDVKKDGGLAKWLL